ncbi:cytochrome c oxidase subunit II [Herpetosiphon giganteus]|uniref:cytochrome c oxidase subunit II n=1 Tax=Herpetosiphon giganteus TaxID=2029754 RepID=UPI0019591E35|nr:cytochrome c oxidase subunit II [Herpetosiphon giganteus]MBM7841853.1 cytochrome c oxidase subunit 2 [Herpetosiphon giganteus]
MPNRSPAKALLRPTATLLLGSVVLAACGQKTPQTTLNPASESTRAIYNLSELLFWLGVVVFLIVQTWLIVSIIKYRQKDSSQVPTQIHGNTKVEIAWTIVPAIIAIVIFVFTFDTIRKIEFMPDEAAGNTLNVKVIGHQWWWEFQYPDIKDASGKPLVTANELWIPSGSYIDVKMTSVDVIHDFWIPGLAGKRDVMPNRESGLWFKADDVADGAPGVFWGQCAEYCGGQHAYMKMRVVVASPADFQKWSTEQSQVAVNTTLPESFTKNCIGCHAVRGTNSAGITGPDLTHFGGRMTIAAGTVDNTREHLYAWLDDPDAVKRGNIMTTAIKADTLTEAEINELVDYLESLNPGTSVKGQQ